MSDAQRTWLRVALTDIVEVQPYDPFSSGPQSYLGSMDVEVGFAGKKGTDVPYVRSHDYKIFSCKAIDDRLHRDCLPLGDCIDQQPQIRPR